MADSVSVDIMAGDAYNERLYWKEAVEKDVAALWGAHYRYGKASATCSGEHFKELCYYRLIRAFYDDQPRFIRLRRRGLFKYLEGVFSTVDPLESQLVRHAHKLPVDTFLPKLVRNLAIAYSQPAERVWKKDGKPAPTSATLTDLYTQGGFNGRLLEAHRRATWASGVLARVLFDEGVPSLQVMTPDEFRYETEEGRPERLSMVVIPERGYDAAGKPEMQYLCWENDRYYRENAKGERVPFPLDPSDDESEIVTEAPNPYGRIPFELLTMTEPTGDDTFSGGLFDVMEANIACNAIQWCADQSVTYEGFAHLVAINIGWAPDSDGKGGKPVFGPGSVTSKDGVASAEAGLVEPSMNYISPNGQFTAIHEYKVNRAKEVMRNHGLPESIAGDTGGVLLTGIARVLERMELLERRKDDIGRLRPFESRLSALVVRVHNTDLAEVSGFQPIEEGLELSVDYAEEPIYQEPEVELKNDVILLAAGLYDPVAFFKKWSGQDASGAVAEVIQIVGDNQRAAAVMAAFLASALGISLPSPAPVETVTAPTGEVPTPEPVESEPVIPA